MLSFSRHDGIGMKLSWLLVTSLINGLTPCVIDWELVTDWYFVHLQIFQNFFESSGNAESLQPMFLSENQNLQDSISTFSAISYLN